MAPIYSLPPELIALISDDLAQEDLLSLRQTCKALSALAHDPHMKTIYGTWSVYLMPSSLTRLVNIVRHRSHVNRFMHHLKIYPTLPSITPRNFGEQPRISNSIMNAYDFIHDPDRDLRYLKVKMVNDHEDNREDIGTYACLATHLEMAFASLPNLKTVEFVTDQADMSRIEFNQCYPSARVTIAEWPATKAKLPRLLLSMYRKPTTNNYWAPFIRTANSTKVFSVLQTLTITGQVGILPYWLGDDADKKLEDNESLFPHLKTLNFIGAHIYDPTNIKVGDLATSKHLAKFFKLVGHNLETVKLVFLRRRVGPQPDHDRTGPLGPHIPNSMSAFPPITTLHRLKYLHIEDARLDVANLIRTLDASPCLETFKMLHCRLPDAEVSCFRLLKHMRALDPPSIKNLRLFFGRDADGIPSLAVKGDTPWAASSTIPPIWADCMAITPQPMQEESLWNPLADTFLHIGYKHLVSEIDRTDDPCLFWLWMTSGNWTRDGQAWIHSDVSNYLFWKEDAAIPEGNTTCAKICGRCLGCTENSWSHSAM
ncbi:hypothetical protein TWF696_003084 [Orbilia brochopaga]|uniref:F-box domain-containing protein n=1 Tax=Orbilia brochopaga TaxID=3140254 RepID=A0AAV9U0T9_9PEZI